MANDQQTGSSVSAFVLTLIVNIALFLIFVGIFVLLKNKEKRVYTPRTYVNTVPATERPEESPKGAFSWVLHLLKKSQSFIIQHAGVDGFFFLRYLFFYATVCFAGGIVLLPVLLAVNATSGGSDTKGFDVIGFANVAHKNRFYAHVFCLWIFFGLLIYCIYRELYYYISFRHAYQTTPYIDSLISSRTLLVTSLPKDFDEVQVKNLFPAATSVTFARDYKDLLKDVKERKKLAGKYEAGLNKVVNKLVKIRAKLEKKGKPLPSEEDQVELYIPEKKQPHHKLKPIIGKKVNTLEYVQTELPKLNEKIKTQQADYIHANAVGSVFLEFPSQLELQRALQAGRYLKELKKSGSKFVTNTAPEDIIWDNLGNSNIVRLGKKTLAVTVLCAMIIFWAIPVAVVGCISNINYLTEKVHFLRFINNMPSKLMGIITGLLPTIALGILMSLVPPFIKFMGKVSGLLTVQQIDLWCHDWYYAFQVVQVFLVTTCASAATAAVTTIIDDPSLVMTLLANNLPKASNFYICYILLQGLSIPGGALAQIVGLALSKVLGRVLDNTPRKKWTRFNTLAHPSWGVVYPVYALIGVITVCYAVISPIIIAFAVVSFTLVYYAYLYNLIYVMGHSIDLRGRNYPKAMFQIFVAIYLAEICLIGLFVLAKLWGPFGLEIAMLVATVLAHLYLKYRFIDLYDAIPVQALYSSAGNTYPTQDQGLKLVKLTGKEYWATNGITTGDEEGTVASSAEKGEQVAQDRDVENAGVSVPSAGLVKRFFKPTTYLTFAELKRVMPLFLNEPVQYTPEQQKALQYLHPSVTDPEPTFWIAQDRLGLLKTLIAKSNGLLVSDENTEFTEKGKPEYTGPPPDYEEAIKV